VLTAEDARLPRPPGSWTTCGRRTPPLIVDELNEINEQIGHRAGKLSELHAQHRPLVLPTVWDVWSARTAVGVGFPALTVGSHPLAESRGAEDNEGQTFAEVIAAHTPPGPGDHSQ